MRITSYVLVFGGLTALPSLVLNLVTTPPRYPEAALRLLELAALMLGAVLCRVMPPRRLNAVLAGCGLAVLAVIGMLAYLGGDPGDRVFAFILMSPLLVVVLLPESRALFVAVSAGAFVAGASALIALRAPTEPLIHWILFYATNIVLAYVGLRRQSRLRTVLDAEQDARVARLTTALAQAAEGLARVTTEEAVLQVASDALYQQGFNTIISRIRNGRIRPVALRWQGGAERSSPALQAALSTEVPLSDLPGFRRFLQSGRALWHEDLSSARSQFVPAEHLSQMMPLLWGRGVDAPIVVADGVFGVLSVQRDELPPSAMGAVELFARHLGAALDNAHKHQRLEERLSEVTHLQRELLQQERLAALGEAAAVVSHEVRNPLGAIVNAVQLLRREGGTANAQALLDMVEEESMRLDSLVHDLLYLARPLQPKQRPVDLELLVTQVVQKRRMEAPAGVEYELVIRDGPLPEIAADPDHLQLALTNLLQNAATASPHGGRIHVVLEREAGGVTLAIEDQGPGIPTENLNRIFEPFFTTRSEGTGLGLAIVKRVVAAHGGTVRAVQAQLGGARFEINLPP